MCGCYQNPSHCGCWARFRAKIPRISKRLVKIYFACFTAMFSSAFAITMMFPFLPFMVEFLLPWLLEDETQVATYAGIVASAMFAGRMIGSYIWGAIADRKGRKPVIIISLILIGISSATFGFSVDYAMAIVFRFMVGLTNGAVGTLKAVVAEVSDDSTQALGVTLLGASWGLGIIIGPAVSGAISDPISQYNLTIENYVLREFLTRFPYSLPCLVNSALCLVSAVVYFSLVPETLGLKKNRRRSEITARDIAVALKSANHSENVNADTAITVSESAALIQNDALENYNEEDSRNETSSADSRASNVDTIEMDINLASGDEKDCNLEDNSRESESINNVPTHSSLEDGEAVSGGGSDDSSESNEDTMTVHGRRLSWTQPGKSIKASLRKNCLYLWDRNVILSQVVYCVFSFGLIGWNEVIPVWAKTSPHLGGLGFTLREIGLALTIAGVLYLPFSFFFFALLEKKFGSIKACYGGLITLIPLTMLFPNIHYLSAWKPLLWFMVCLILTINQVALGVTVSCTILFVNNSVTFEKLGTINGLAMTLTSFGRTLAPIVAGGVFSLSLSATLNGYLYPLDYRLVFTIIGLTYLMCVLFTACLPTSINKQKIIEDVD